MDHRSYTPRHHVLVNEEISLGADMGTHVNVPNDQPIRDRIEDRPPQTHECYQPNNIPEHLQGHVPQGEEEQQVCCRYGDALHFHFILQ